MFNDNVTKQVESLNHYISLFRDLTLGVTIALTCVIAYFGGDPTKLTVLDWTKLVSAASLVVVAPVGVFFLVKFILTFYHWVLGLLQTKLEAKFTGLFSGHPKLKNFFDEGNKILKTYSDFIVKAYPYLYAMVSLAFAVAVFYKLLLKYIPS